MKIGVRALIVVLAAAGAGAVYGDTIHGCVGESGNLRVVVGAGGCRVSESEISWNSVGPQGPPGPSAPAPTVIGTIQFDNGAPIDIYDSSAEFANVVVFGGGGAGKVEFKDLTIRKKPDANSPVLFLKCANGSIFNKVTVTVHGAQGAGDLVLELGVVFVDDVHYETAPAPVNSLEDVSLSFGKIKVSAGGAFACWNRINNTAGCP